MSHKLSAQQIRELLRAADPLRDGDSPRETDVARLRRAVLAEIPAPDQTTRWRLAPVLATAVLLLLALHVGFTLFQSDRRGADPSELAATREPSTTPAADAEGPGRRQQVQFVTANGTRVIWVLSSDLSL